MEFRYDLNTKVYFMHNGQAYEGIIIKRIHEETFHFADDHTYEKDCVSTDKFYFICYKQGTTVFKEWEFNNNVFLSKDRFIQEKVIIK